MRRATAAYEAASPSSSASFLRAAATTALVACADAVSFVPNLRATYRSTCSMSAVCRLMMARASPTLRRRGALGRSALRAAATRDGSRRAARRWVGGLVGSCSRPARTACG